MARTLGTDAILVVPGAVIVPWLPDSEIVPYDTAHERARDAIADLVSDAEKARVAIAVENVWNGMFLSPIELHDFIDSIGSEYVGAYFDVGNCIGTGCPEDWIRILGSRIKRVHMKDYRRSAAGLGGFVGLLEGDANWPKVMAALKEAGYDGSLTVETSPYAYAPDVVLRHASTSLDAIMAMQ
jgi:hexulose-6-phosphate isomerase